MKNPSRLPAVLTRRAFGSRVLAAAGSAAALLGCRSTTGDLTLACAAGWRTIVTRAVSDFESRHNTPVRTLYDGSGRLAATIRLRGGVDLFLSADLTYLNSLQDDLRFADIRITPLREQHVRCVRATDAPTRTLDELLDGEARISLASPDTAAVSRVLRRALGTETFGRLTAKAYTRTTVTEVAADVAKLNAADYGFIWDTTWSSSVDFRDVPMPKLKDAVGTVAIGRFPGRDADPTKVRALEAAVSQAVRTAPLDDTASIPRGHKRRVAGD